MRKINIFLLIVGLFILIAQTSSAQYAFRVMASKGTSKVNSVKKLYPGSKLNSSDKVKVYSNSYLSLAHKDGGTVKIAKSGTYSVSDLSKKLKASKKSSNQRFKQFIIGELTKNKVDVNKNYRSNQNVTGSVERSMDMVNIAASDATPIILILPSQTGNKLYGDKVMVEWLPIKEGVTYVIDVLNDFDTKVHTVETKETKFDFDKKILNKKSEEADDVASDMYKINIKVKENENFKTGAESPAISLIESNDKMKVALKKFDEDNKDRLGSTSYFMDKADLFAEHELLLDAMAAYQEAVKLEPEMKLAYYDFLVSNKIAGYERVEEEKKEEAVEEKKDGMGAPDNK